LIAAAGLSVYHASKWALEGLSQALAQEVRDFGIKVTIVEPTGYRTAAEEAARRSAPIPAYERQQALQRQHRAAVDAREGNPVATRAAILEVVDAEDPPLRIFFGAGALQTVESDYQRRLDNWRKWEPVSVAAHGTLPE
jgi:NAD(P)-dependent dehydrogenase (short-subunit alcohol dehydrogenase family)